MKYPMMNDPTVLKCTIFRDSTGTVYNCTVLKNSITVSLIDLQSQKIGIRYLKGTIFGGS